MDVSIRFWNQTNNMVETRYYVSQFLHRPNASELLRSLTAASHDLEDEKLLQLAMDGLSVNWNVLDDQRAEKDLSKTLNIGSCSQHIVHGALKNGTTITEWSIVKILKAMYWILHDSPARRDVYMKD